MQSSTRTGARIRARRLDLGLRQSDLAERAGISASYLNLIEHDKRRIAGKLLTEIAAALDIAPGLLTDGAERGVLDAMREAASAWDGGSVEAARADELAARYPGWAGLIVAQAARITAVEARAQMLADRITYDPDLATALHGVISAATAIRSTAAILTSDEAIDAEWQTRFHRNIHDDAVRLAAESDALVTYFDPPDHGEAVPNSPLQEVEAFLDTLNWQFDPSEGGGTPDTAQLRKPAREIFDNWAAVCLEDQKALPRSALDQAIAAHRGDVWSIVEASGQPVSRVLRQLAFGGPLSGLPPLGLVICDAGGFPTLLKEVAGFAFPRGTACPLWPVYTALGQVGRPLEADVVLPGQPETRLRCWSIAEQVGPMLPDRPPQVQATMLVMPDPTPGPSTPIPVGVSCRICPRDGCKARREPSALGASQSDRL